MLTKQDKQYLKEIVSAFQEISKAEKRNCQDETEIELLDNNIQKCDKLIEKLQ